MVKIFRCQNCKELKFFSNSKVVDGKELCPFCAKMALEYRDEKRLIKQSRLRKNSVKKVRKYNEKEKIANEKLKEELKREELKRKEKERLLKEKAEAKKKVQLEKEKNAIKPGSVIIPTNKNLSGKSKKLAEAEKLSEVYNTVLYVHATVKRLKAIEWRNNKEKTILNKEREVRHTHKGGWSQEKFQRFVKSKKKTALDWIEDNLSRKGVLRPPYEKVVLESDKKDLEAGLSKVMQSLLK
ncbi:MAG: hypothetical protein ABIG93_04755 [archaeon]|nr:hypothetical protein [Nanoarchaeota archaeon]